MSSPPRLANIGAEEGDWRAFRDLPAVRSTALLWAELFEPEPVFDWIDASELQAWLNTPEARERAEQNRCPLAGAEPERVRAVHDKAFALRVARERGLIPEPLRESLHALDPGELRAPGAEQRIIALIEAWPPEFKKRFSLKPRFGGSGRGRVSALPELRGALPRLAERDGAILEPWLERNQDLSAQLVLGGEAGLLLLGTLELLTSGSGVYRGHRGWVDGRGRVASGSDHDPALREAAVEIANTARENGYRGPCGLDAFVFRLRGREWLRPIVELNARYTTGIVALGQLRRKLGRLRREQGLSATRPLAFHFGLEPPGEKWPELAAPGATYPLTAGAGLLVAPARADIETALARSGSATG